ncbi:MAG: DUF4445 domain-containing protein [Rhodospirillaceae bacterium]|nr:DUF4445 domain-containing protein [Rhodospirillaceae bacterium]
MATEDAPAAGEVQVVFTPSGRRGRFAAGTTVLDAARSLGVYIESVCGGQGLCARCQVEVAEGDFAKHKLKSRADHLSGWTEAETQWEGRHRLKPGRRLGCRAQMLGDLVIDVPADAQVNRQVVRKRAEMRRVPADPRVTLHTVTVAEPDMHHPSGDLERLCTALHEQHGLALPICDRAVLAGLQPTLRKGDWQVTAAVLDTAPRPVIVALWPGAETRALGVAVDIGSTTIAAHLCDLRSGRVIGSAGMMNPQIRFGEDVMSRVSYVQMHPGAHHDMARVVREAVNVLVVKVTGEAGAAPEDVVEAVVVGNPIMHHLFLGLDPVELGGAPFALATASAQDLPARELDIAIAPGGRIYVLPCIAGHVGADAAAMVLAEAPHRAEPVTLLIDVGTNAEIVLGSSRRLLAASSPTGPAFEGAEISCGQRAAPGAIERVRIDRETLEPKVKVIGCDLWSNEPGFAEETEMLGVTGICGSGIIEVIGEMLMAGLLDRNGVIQGALAERTPRLQPDGRTWRYVLHDGDPPIHVTQPDIRAIQLAKAALHAGAKLLMARYGVDQVDRIRLAGAFGSHIDPQYAMLLGMIPDCDLGHVAAIGNAAGTGARIALVDRKARDEIEQVVRDIEKVETAVEADFQRHFVDAMALPHRTDAYPHLARAFELPTPAEPAATGRRRRRSA